MVKPATTTPVRRRHVALRSTRALAFAAAAGLSALAGCSNLPDLPAPLGTPDKVPPRPAVQPQYPEMNGPVAPRESKPLTEAERKRLEAELIAARERQAAQGKAAAQPPAR